MDPKNIQGKEEFSISYKSLSNRNLKIFDNEKNYIGGLLFEKEIENAFVTPLNKNILIYSSNIVHFYKIEDLLFENIISRYSRKVVPLTTKERLKFGLPPIQQ